MKLTEDLETTITRLNNKGFQGEIKVSFEDLEKGTKFDINGDKIGWSASIIKLPIMVATLSEWDKGKLSFDEKLTINHKFKLEEDDYCSLLTEGKEIAIPFLINKMIYDSDNEATNMLADRIGIQTINHYMWSWGMNNTMLGHLLCPKVPRYTSSFNPDGSNITTPNDMTQILKHIYDNKDNTLSENTKELSKIIIDNTYRRQISLPGHYAKGKNGLITDDETGSDIHEVGIIDDRYIISIMINKIYPGFWINEKTGVYYQGEYPTKKKIIPSYVIYENLMKNIGRCIKENKKCKH